MSTQAHPSAQPWHAGERSLQARAGVAARMEDVGLRVVRDYMPDQHREFFAQLPMVVLGAVAPDGRVWATLRAGKPGFLNSPDATTLNIAMAREPADPADAGMEDGSAIGLLGIDLLTRRRNRMNGTARRGAGGGDGSDGVLRIDVGQSFGNCPQYIQKRVVEFTRAPGAPAPAAARHFTALDARARALIGSADTFFVASYADLDEGERQVDVSHRGGKPGFVRIDADGGLTIPDFAGNLFFNTLGNFVVNPIAGLVFADFGTGELLQLSGKAEVILDSPEIAAFQGAERLWRFLPEQIVRRDEALPLRWQPQADGASPNSLMTGSWDEAASRQRAAALANAWRPLRVARIVDESSVIRSFHLEPADGAGRVAHLAGQFLPIRVTLAGHAQPVMRTYTLSVSPADDVYRISVKRDGTVSRHLHDNVKVGDLIEARAPSGHFTIDTAERRPAVLLAAGIGVTPMLAMLRQIVYEGLRKRRVRPTWFFHSARTAAERAFSKELATLTESAGGAVELVRLLSDPKDATRGKDYDVSGRIDIDLLRARLPLDDYDFYLCGPTAFMQSLYDGLRALNIADSRIHAEAFGASSLVRSRDAGRPAPPTARPALQPVPVTFVQSAKEARWTPGGGSLLELAEQRGLAPAFGCRGGSCGSCSTRVLQGAVAYAKAPEFDVAQGEALICCAVPAAVDGDGNQAVVPLQLDL
ncbi:pyridoxamine 5'-phosphate oxidase family protein [Cupriavidus basilensis]|uniref:Pyridoxamine 5'-phosphate oxidase family protein n=1 Tax=Cupriavidus basilensis TaxID=68895 RepID=A0A643FY79_9BURK|nr:pyridoxamine 5'-phosphate oxidase family protein [Cupriavidus basilensis]QOT80465.1 pyridoxamine 5'-phosphate oxidase family protein [Cupriavidus basilensis]